MRLSALLLFVLVLASNVVAAAATQLWAINLGEAWAGSDLAFRFDPDNPLPVPAAFPSGELIAVWGATYEAASGTLYVSGTYNEPTSFSSAIAVYRGGPQGLDLVSASTAGLEGYQWAAGIEYMNGSLYGIAYDDYATGNNLFFRIDNPGTDLQTATQIGPPLGPRMEMGIPYALCKDGQGGLIAGFGVFFVHDEAAILYRIDVDTGEATHLHTYSESDVYPTFESLSLVQNRLFGMTTLGSVFEIDTQTYELLEICDLPDWGWTALAVVPEPSGSALLAAGLLPLILRIRRR